MRERRPEGEGRCSSYCNATGTKENKTNTSRKKLKTLTEDSNQQPVKRKKKRRRNKKQETRNKKQEKQQQQQQNNKIPQGCSLQK
jgi:hypothetical protein